MIKDVEPQELNVSLLTAHDCCLVLNEKAIIFKEPYLNAFEGRNTHVEKHPIQDRHRNKLPRAEVKR